VDIVDYLSTLKNQPLTPGAQAPPTTSPKR
jgi:hypothetical protein